METKVTEQEMVQVEPCTPAEEPTTVAEPVVTETAEPAATEPSLESRVRELVSRMVAEELETAVAEAYRRGRNEKIEQLTRDMPAVGDADDDDEAGPVPHLTRRSIWDS